MFLFSFFAEDDSASGDRLPESLSYPLNGVNVCQVRH